MFQSSIYIKFLFFSLVGISLNIRGQEISISNFCQFSGSDSLECGRIKKVKYEELPKNDTLRLSMQKVLKNLSLSNKRIVLGTIDYLGASGIFFKPQDSLNCYIVFDEKLKSDYWGIMGILLHELGHYLNDHEKLCSNPELELDADLFAGRALGLLGATKEEALKCLNLITEKPHINYPPKSERSNRLLAGYQNYLLSVDLTSFTSVNPTVIWSKLKECDSVYIDTIGIRLPKLGKWDTMFSDLKTRTGVIGFFDPELGILYLTSNNSTYSLPNFKNEIEGIGLLVNDKTSLTYMRFGQRSYRLYNKSKIVPLNQVDLENRYFLPNGRDYCLPFKNEKNVVILKNYTFVNNGVLMPAFYK